MRRREAITLQGRRSLVTVARSLPPTPPAPLVYDWVDLAPITHPSARNSPGLAWDPIQSKVLLYAGSPFPLHDTWLFDFGDNNWADAAPVHYPRNAVLPTDPSGFGRGHTAWDGERVIQVNSATWGDEHPGYGRENVWGFESGDWTQLYLSSDIINMILPNEIRWLGSYPLALGGWHMSSTFDVFNDDKTYKWDHDSLTLTEIFPSIAINPLRSGGQIAFDGTDAYYFGSTSFDTFFPNQLYKWNFSDEDWEVVSTVDSPPYRVSGAFAYDALTDSFVLFGGRLTSDLSYAADTWIFDRVNWRQITTEHSPSGRYLAGIESTPSGILLFGGTNGSSNYSDTWTLRTV